MLNVVRGSFRSLQDRLLATLMEKPRWAPVTVIARSQRLIRHLQRALARRGTVLNVRLTTMEGVATDLAETEGRNVIDDDIVVRHLVVGLTDRFFRGTPFLGQAVRSHRTASALHASIRDMRDAGVPAERLPSILRDEFSKFHEQGKVAEIFKLSQLYGEALREFNLMDQADLLRAAEAKVDALPDRVVVYGYYDMTQVQVDFLDALRRSKEVEMYFPSPNDPAWGAYAQRFYDTHIAGLARSCALLPSPAAVENKPMVINAAGTHDEIWAVAKEILRLEIPFDRVGVIARSLDGVIDIIDRVFRDHAIPFRSSARRSLRRTAEGRAAELLLTMEDRGYDRPSMMELFGSGVARLPEGSDPVAWNLATGELAIGRREKEWRRRLASARTSGVKIASCGLTIPGAEIGRLASAFERVVETRLPERGTWTEFAAAAERAVRSMFRAPTEHLLRAVASTAEIDRVALAPVTRAEFLDALLRRFDEPTLPVGVDNCAGVQVIDAMAARGLLFDAVFVIGMNEKIFPRFITEDPFLRDHNRAELRALSGGKLDPKTAGYGEERLLFRFAIESAPRVTLTYQRADDKGRLLVPSIFLREIATGDLRSIDRLPVTRVEKVPEIELLTTAELCMRGLLPAENRMTVAEIEHGRAIGPRDGLAGPEAGRHRLSPTFVERYAACPMRAFLERVIRIAPLESPEEGEDAEPLDLGILCHRALERLYRSPDPNERTLEAIWEEERAKIAGEIFVRYPLHWEVQSRKILEALRAFLRWDLEESRSEGERKILVEEELALAPYAGDRFSGRSDRIVVSGTTLRVDDYKWKKYRKIGDDVGKCRQAQLPIYLHLAGRLMRTRGMEIERSEGRLLCLRAFGSFNDLAEAAGEKAPKIAATIDTATIEEEGFEENLRTMIGFIRRGMFFVAPGHDCDYCPYPIACRMNHPPTVRRARKDAGVEPFWTIHDGKPDR